MFYHKNVNRFTIFSAKD